jgi:formylglycine-generating enzyme required for sulfatase activity
MEPAVGTFSRGRPAQPLTAADVAAISPKDSFKECDVCPEMAVVPAGEFMMGSPADEEGRNENEGPVRKVTIRKTLAVGKFEVTRGEFAVFVRASGGKGPDDCRTWTGREWKQQVDKNWASPGFEQTDRHPVTCVSWDDASAFAKWLTDKTGKQYRLLSEAEWEYAARAGTITAFSTGPTITTDQANFDGNYTYAGSAKGAARGKTLAVGSLMPNAFGLYDMHGNVWEWVADCYESTYLNAPRNGSARVSSSCEARVLRGGSWFHWPRNARSADRIRYQPSIRYNYLGFRVARTL